MKHYLLNAWILTVLLMICPAPLQAMLGEGSFVGTGGYAIGGTPYYYAGLSYYYDPNMDQLWNGQKWVFRTGAQLPPRCCKTNPCSSCGDRQRSCLEEPCTINKCLNVYKNLTGDKL